MLRRLIPLVLLLMVLALPALAHDFTGSGDCDGWTLQLDGLWEAHTIYIDGVAVPLQLTHFISDTSSDTERTFTVFWDKARNDVTQTHTLQRVLNCPTTTTTSTTTPTTTTSTTTTAPTTTTGVPPTTTQPVTTTTGPTTTTLVTTTTTEGTTTTGPTSTTTVPAATPPPAAELPFTGFDPTLAVTAIGLLTVVGAGLVRLTQKAK